MTDLYYLFQDLGIAETFEDHEEFNRIKAQISKLGNFQRLKFNHEKKADQVYWLQRAHETTITIEHIDGTETVENRLEYEITKGRVNRNDPLLKYIIRK